MLIGVEEIIITNNEDWKFRLHYQMLIALGNLVNQKDVVLTDIKKDVEKQIGEDELLARRLQEEEWRGGEKNKARSDKSANPDTCKKDEKPQKKDEHDKDDEEGLGKKSASSQPSLASGIGISTALSQEQKPESGKDSSKRKHEETDVGSPTESLTREQKTDTNLAQRWNQSTGKTKAWGKPEPSTQTAIPVKQVTPTAEDQKAKLVPTASQSEGKQVPPDSQHENLPTGRRF